MNLESVVLWLKFHLCLSYALFSDVPNIVIDHVSSRVPAILICLVRKSNQKHHSSPHFPHRLQGKVYAIDSVIEANCVLYQQDAVEAFRVVLQIEAADLYFLVVS